MNDLEKCTAEMKRIANDGIFWLFKAGGDVTALTSEEITSTLISSLINVGGYQNVSIAVGSNHQRYLRATDKAGRVLEATLTLSPELKDVDKEFFIDDLFADVLNGHRKKCVEESEHSVIKELEDGTLSMLVVGSLCPIRMPNYRLIPDEEF